MFTLTAVCLFVLKSSSSLSSLVFIEKLTDATDYTHTKKLVTTTKLLLLLLLGILLSQMCCACSFYKKLAEGVLTECYSSDHHKAALLVVRPMKNYNDRTPLDIAVRADNKEFVALAACQSVLTVIWFGSLKDDSSYRNLKVHIWCFRYCLCIIIIL